MISMDQMTAIRKLVVEEIGYALGVIQKDRGEGVPLSDLAGEMGEAIAVGQAAYLRKWNEIADEENARIDAEAKADPSAGFTAASAGFLKAMAGEDKCDCPVCKLRRQMDGRAIPTDLMEEARRERARKVAGLLADVLKDAFRAEGQKVDVSVVEVPNGDDAEAEGGDE